MSFGDVRVHHDSTSQRAARALDAHAFTVGQHVHFAAGRYRPAERRGLHLLAHELTHTIQQRSAMPVASLRGPIEVDSPSSPLEREAERTADAVVSRASEPRQQESSSRPPGSRRSLIHLAARGGSAKRVQRSIGEFFARLFFEGTFSDEELLRYLEYLDDHAEIEGSYDSDNKARAIVRRWRAGDSQFQPTRTQKQLMLLEMIDGPTLDDDEEAILELLRGSEPADVRALLATAGGEDSLRKEFHGKQLDDLDAFLAQWHEDPRNRPVAAGELGSRQTAVREVVVNQDTPQTVTVKYSDGRIESDICSSGKGTCCVEPGAETGPSSADTRVRDSNWTPLGAHRVTLTEPDHKGIRFWTQFHWRGIALHEYTPVDGTPLSHGCVRLHAGIAERIQRGAVKNQTRVRVTGSARPRCGHGALEHEWKKDFAGARAEDGEVDTELRKHLRLAFGVDGAELDRRIQDREIPRCQPLRGAGRRRGSGR